MSGALKLGGALALMNIAQLVIWAMPFWLFGVLTSAAGTAANSHLLVETSGPHFADLL